MNDRPDRDSGFGDGGNLSTMLDDLPDIDPPSTLVSDVMSAIRCDVRPVTNDLRHSGVRRNRTMARRMLWGVAAVAAVVLIAMRITGFPPTGRGTEGTIGAAQRYQAE